MAPPLVKGRALARRRVSGILFIVVISLLIQTAVWMYQKKFTSVIHVNLMTDRVGNQLSMHADVKVRGIVIGEVRKVTSNGEQATLELALNPGKAELVPKDSTAQLLPKTLFGEKQVVLIPPVSSSAGHLEDGDVISQDHSATALETETALNDLMPLLQRLQPQELSTALNAIGNSLRDRGNEVGGNAALMASYLKQLNPAVPQIGDDLQRLATLAQNLQETSPDLLRELDNLAAVSRSDAQQRAQLDAFLTSSTRAAKAAQDFVAPNEQRLVALAKDSTHVLDVYARFSAVFPCMLNRIAFSEIEGERVFGKGQPGLHITVELTRDHGGYVPNQDEPQYKENRNFACFGLGSKPIIPFPSYANAQDGYRDSEPAEDPHKGPGGCCDGASWMPSVAGSPDGTVVHRAEMPTGTTELDALLLGPLTG